MIITRNLFKLCVFPAQIADNHRTREQEQCVYHDEP